MTRGNEIEIIMGSLAMPLNIEGIRVSIVGIMTWKTKEHQSLWM
jgi:hypothetical protein